MEIQRDSQAFGKPDSRDWEHDKRWVWGRENKYQS